MNKLALAFLFLISSFPLRAEELFSREKLVAWCIVPFDAKQRTPAQRAAMVVRLGLTRVAYDWRERHVAEFEEEILQYQKHGIEFFAFWGVHEKAFALFEKYKLHPQVWLMAANPPAATQDEKVRLAAIALLPAVEQTRKLGSKLAIYNHGGWNGEPENMAAIAEYLRAHHDGGHVGIVYNLHHGHAHISDFATKWKIMQPYLLAVNLNGMEVAGDANGRKILHLAEGDRELDMMRIMEQSGWRGPVGIINHREETDCEVTLRNNLAGFDWLHKELSQPGAGGPRPKFADGNPTRVTTSSTSAEGRFGKALDARSSGMVIAGDDAFRKSPLTVECWARLRNAANYNILVASDPKSSAAHWELYTHAGNGEFSVYLPGRGGDFRSGVTICDDNWHHVAAAIGDSRIRLFVDGKLVKEAPLPELKGSVKPGDLGIGRLAEGGIGCNGLVDEVHITRGVREISVLPAAAPIRSDSTLGLWSLDEPQKSTASVLPVRAPLIPESYPQHAHNVNRDRVFNFYAKQAADWRNNPRDLLPEFPGLDGGVMGHWGNQNEQTWSDGRWNEMDIGSCMAGVFRSAKDTTIAKALCVKVGDHSACYDPLTDEWKAVWQGGFVKFSAVRHGLMDGILMNGKRVDETVARSGPIPKYRGYFRHGERTIFALGDDGLMSLKMENGTLQRETGESLRSLTKGGPTQWPQILETALMPGDSVPGSPYVVDTLTLPFGNPWKSLFFLGGHDFFANGDVAVCTMTGDVWRLSIGSKLKWKRMAAGLHQPLGLLVIDDKVYVQGRDQITRLHDLNGDGEADFYECLTNDFDTPTGGHDYMCGLERDRTGNFYTVSGKQGLLRIVPGKRAEVMASGFRNPDGIGLASDGTLTVPYSEGEWTPTSAIAQISIGGYYNYPGPKPGVKSLPPLLWLPRGEDNSAGGQTWVPDDRWGPLNGQMIHLSYGAGTHFLVLRQNVNDVWQGAAVPLPGGFNAGAHRGRFSPHDGQLYVSGMTGWGTYTPDDGCLHRVRYAGGAANLPVAFEARDNGILITFSEKPHISASNAALHFAQCWNYRVSAAYGSPELSLRQPGKPGHDVLQITSAHLVGDGRQLFLEIPQLQPAAQIHLVVQPQPGISRELFLTAHALGLPFTQFPGYHAVAKTLHAAHASSADIALKPVKWEQGAPGRELRIQTTAGLQFAQKELKAKTGERISLTFENPDVMPHNWVLVKTDAAQRVGDLATKLIAAPDALARHYVPDSADVLVHTRVVDPQKATTIHFNAPAQPGHYPYVCTFPGHFAIMRGVLIVE